MTKPLSEADKALLSEAAQSYAARMHIPLGQARAMVWQVYQLNGLAMARAFGLGKSPQLKARRNVSEAAWAALNEMRARLGVRKRG